ncbi:MAG TPA: aminoacyl-tRNA hydrolase [Kiritimatiellae bacterium]|nr:aminoacyl-tRNA hydrolase [Kiritimatiellia bacterium]
MQVVVGLGNPGRRYSNTRHNIGFAVVERLAEQWGKRFRRKWGTQSLVASGVLEGRPVWLCKPTCFMNRSGGAVRALLRKAGAGPEALVVVVDDADLPVGRVRVRPRGGSGGHNGLKSVIAALGTEDFIRVRVGIGRPVAGGDMVEYVLSGFRPEEREQVDEVVGLAAEAVKRIMTEGVESAMNRING